MITQKETIQSKRAELEKAISKIGHYRMEQFEQDAKRYVKAIKEGRVICSIGSVSSSGMNRTIKFLAPEKGVNSFQYLNFYALFLSLGFTPARNSRDYFTINGCGMDMIFDTNYRIIHKLYNMGYITKKTCSELCQKTPTVI